MMMMVWSRVGLLLLARSLFVYTHTRSHLYIQYLLLLSLLFIVLLLCTIFVAIKKPAKAAGNFVLGRPGEFQRSNRADDKTSL